MSDCHCMRRSGESAVLTLRRAGIPFVEAVALEQLPVTCAVVAELGERPLLPRMRRVLYHAAEPPAACNRTFSQRCMSSRGRVRFRSMTITPAPTHACLSVHFECPYTRITARILASLPALKPHSAPLRIIDHLCVDSHNCLLYTSLTCLFIVILCISTLPCYNRPRACYPITTLVQSVIVPKRIRLLFRLLLSRPLAGVCAPVREYLLGSPSRPISMGCVSVAASLRHEGDSLPARTRGLEAYDGDHFAKAADPLLGGGLRNQDKAVMQFDSSLWRSDATRLRPAACLGTSGGSRRARAAPPRPLAHPLLSAPFRSHREPHNASPSVCARGRWAQLPLTHPRGVDASGTATSQAVAECRYTCTYGTYQLPHAFGIAPGEQTPFHAGPHLAISIRHPAPGNHKFSSTDGGPFP